MIVLLRLVSQNNNKEQDRIFKIRRNQEVCQMEGRI